MSKVEVVTSVERRRKWSDEEKDRILREALEPQANVSQIARKYKIEPSQIYIWKKQTNSGIPSKPMSYDEVTMLITRIKHLEQVLGRKTAELEMLKESFHH